MGVSSSCAFFRLCRVPNFKTAATADQRDLAFQPKLLAKIVRQNETALFVGGAMLSAGVELAKKNAAIARGNIGVSFGSARSYEKILQAT